MPPLKPKQTMPVPPPTLPSSTAPGFAASMAAMAVAGVTWKPPRSFSRPSQVSATTGQVASPKVFCDQRWMPA